MKGYIQTKWGWKRITGGNWSQMKIVLAEIKAIILVE